MKTHRTIGYRLHTQTQAKARKLAGTAGACRFVWNHFVAKLRGEYATHNECHYRFYSLGKRFTSLRRDEDTWLQEYSMAIVRQSLKPIETAYRQFFKKEGGRPGFHVRLSG